MKKILTISMLLVASLCLPACKDQPKPPVPASTDDSSTLSSVHKPALQADSQTLTDFDSIIVDVLAADIRVIPGEQWAISYNLSEKEPLERFGVEDGTLYVETAFDPKEYFDRYEDWFVTVTVPEGTSLSEVELDTLSGNVDISGFSCDTASLSSTSGTVGVEDVTAQKMKLGSTSGEISASGLVADSLDAETVSSHITLNGEFGNLKAGTVSGGTNVSGSISEMGSLKSTSGDIDLLLDHAASLQASSLGTIILNGERVKSPLELDNGVPVILKSVSGDISIQTNS